MAKNLRAKIPAADTLLVCDSNAAVTARFVAEAGAAAERKVGDVRVCEDAREVAERCVSCCVSYLSLGVCCPSFVVRMMSMFHP